MATVILAQGALARVYLHKGAEKPPLGISLLFWIGIGALSLAAVAVLAGALVGAPMWKTLTHRGNVSHNHPTPA